MLVKLDSAANEPLFAQLAAQVRGALADGSIREGDRLPAARDLAASLEINLHTVLRAYQELRDEGLIELRRGRGAVVTELAGQDLAALRRALAEAAAESRRLNLSAETAIALLKEELR